MKKIFRLGTEKDKVSRYRPPILESAHYVVSLTAPECHPFHIYYTNFLHALLFYSKERDSRILWNTERFLLDYTQSYFMRQQPSLSCWEPQILL
jgi:hypothetical protein